MDDWNRKQHGGSGLMRAGARRAASTRRCGARDAQVPARPGWSRGARPCAATASARTGAFCAPHARSRALLPLPQPRREHAQGTGAALGAAHGAGVPEASTHLALDDVRESIRELEYYRERFLRSPSGCLAGEEHPGLHHGIRIERQAVDALFDQPRASSGWSEGPWPQMPTYLPCALQALIAIDMKRLDRVVALVEQLRAPRRNRGRGRA